MPKKLKSINMREVSLPIFRGDYSPTNHSFAIKELYGSCFSIGNNIVMTAAHVVDAVQESLEKNPGSVVIGPPSITEGMGMIAGIVDYEKLGLDVGLIRFEYVDRDRTVTPLDVPWNISRFNLETQLVCPGFGLGYEPDEPIPSVAQRTLIGHHVSLRNKYRPPNWKGDPFPAYELSFGIPKFHSGSPLIVADNASNFYIVGMVIGNSNSQFLAHYETEIVDDGTTKHTVERYDSLRFGIAVPSTGIVELHSDMLGTLLGNYLMHEELLSE